MHNPKKELMRNRPRHSTTGDDTPTLSKFCPKMSDFSVPINAYYHDKLQRIADHIEEQTGMPASRRQIAAKAVRDAIDAQAIRLGL